MPRSGVAADAGTRRGGRRSGSLPLRGLTDASRNRAGAWRLLPDPLAIGEHLPGLSIGSRLLNQARVGLVAGEAEATLAFAAHWEQLAAGAGSRRWQMEALLLQALAQAKLGKRTAGQSALQKSLALAQSQGYLRLFLDGGEAVRDLLVGLYPFLTDPALAQFARRILDAGNRMPPGQILVRVGQSGWEAGDSEADFLAVQAAVDNWCRIRRRISTVALVDRSSRWWAVSTRRS